MLSHLLATVEVGPRKKISLTFLRGEVGTMTAVGPPAGLLATALWLGVGWCSRRLGQLLSWMCPPAAKTVWVAAKWLCWGIWGSLSWFFWLVELAVRLFWGAE